MISAADLRERFAAARGFPLDSFQEQALDAVDAGRHVLVAAPTGSGKTLVAEYAIDHARATGGKAFYTTPLKALSNQKYGDLVREHGSEAVGLLTGDNSINGDAPIVVMTTEVLRNMIYAASPALDGLSVVVLDEVHYLQDRYRGPVWEEVIVHLDTAVRLVCLSATVSNAEEVAAWIETVRGPTTAVIEEQRPVTLEHRYLVGERGADALHLMPTFIEDHGRLVANPDVARLDQRGGRNSSSAGEGDRTGRRANVGRRGGPHRGGGSAAPRTRLRTPSRSETVERLDREGMLPGIVFVFSRAGCDQAVQQCLADGLRLTDTNERARLRQIAEAHTDDLPADDLEVLGYRDWLAGLESGFAAHHAGMVPPMKEAVEEAFSAGLAKVVFATETLALGINMPARSVVIEKLSKFTGERHEFLTPGEYTQLTGRAGRRGIDARGYAVVLWSPFVPFDQVASLASRRSDALTSAFHPTYNMAANLVRRYSKFEAHHLLNLSFAQFHADRDVVALERQLERTRTNLARQRELIPGDLGEIEEYASLLVELDVARAGRRGGGSRRVADALEALRPGDVVLVRGRGGRVAVLGHDQRKKQTPRIVAIDTRRAVVRLGPDDFDASPRRVGSVDLPQPVNARNPAFRKQVADRLRNAKLRDQQLRSKSHDRRIAALERQLADHPAADDPNLRSRLRAASSVARLERDVQRLERRIRGRNDSLARHFDRVLRVLGAWGYVDGWSLTEAGERLARVYNETDLLLAVAIGAGQLDGLRVPEMAALVSCFTYERRGPESDAAMPPPRWPTKTVALRWRAIDKIARDLQHDEDEAGLPETRSPDPGFTPYAYEWASGESLADVLDDDEMTGGDFVRHVKQCIDLLRQVGDVAPNEATRERAREAADACHRGVVAASGVAASSTSPA
ncbi:MAG: DEAD/DEAH box helicase [Acidimicrobiia bacterium]